MDLFNANNANGRTPNLALLQQYDIVVVSSYDTFANSTTLGNNLADYVDAAGIVVQLPFSFNDPDQTTGINGRWTSGGYSPYLYPTALANGAATLGTFNAAHPLMQGVTALQSNYHQVMPLATGATQVAAWSNSDSLIATKLVGTHTTIGVTAHIGSDAIWSGDFPRVIANAGRWLKPAGCPTPTPTPAPTPPPDCTRPALFVVHAPATGTVGAPFSFTVTAMCSPIFVDPNYFGVVHFTSSDPAAELPPNSGMSNGFGSFSATLHTLGSWTITVTDASDGSITGTSSPIIVGPVPTPTPTLTPTPTQPPPGCGTFSNPVAVNIPASGNYGIASPYPSNIVVSGLGGAITRITVAMNGLNHANPADIDILLVGPEGQYAFIMSDVGDSHAVTGINLVLDDSAPDPLPDFDPLVSGTFRPTNINEQPCNFGGSVIDPFPSPAPWVGSTGSALSAFNGTNPNGTWGLYVVDDYSFSGTTGSLPAGWAITISTDNCAGPTPPPQPTPTPGTTHFALVAPGGVYQGESFQFTVTALDRFNNVVTNYPGTVHFTSSDPYGASLPPDSSLTNGTGTFTGAVYAFMYSVTITATDTSIPSITGTSNCIGVFKHPPPTPTPTPQPPNISGSISYCSNPVPGPVPNVTLNRTGSTSGSTLSDSSGNYQFSSLPYNGIYSVTPTKADRVPGSAGINTIDVLAVQRHFLVIGTPLSGCRLAAADVSGDSAINTVDVLAIQRFFLGRTTGIANVGKYQFDPSSRSYSHLNSDQTAQNYDTLVFGDVASPFAE